MFAGAAREAVFSNPDVIRRVQADFVPVALKAGLINMPPADDEGRLYREISRSKPAPQGICVVNSAGKVLDWTLMFDDDQSVIDFLDHALERFKKYPDAGRQFAAERYMRFPSRKLDDVKDSGNVSLAPERHPEGKWCPARPRIAPGTIVARLFGRALDADGKPAADTTSQEHYVEDRFELPVAMQIELARALAEAGAARFQLAEDLGRLFVSHAFLGQLDVNPLGGIAGGEDAQNELQRCEFWAQLHGPGNDGSTVLRIEGKSNAEGRSGDGRQGDGRLWRHDVELAWQGYVEMKQDRMTRLLLVAQGLENIEWRNVLQNLHARADVTQLPGGHTIDLSCGVRYGIIGEPVAADEACADDAPPQHLPDEARKEVVEALGGGAFLVFRDQVQEELNLSDDQKQKLMATFSEYAQETKKVFDKIAELKPAEPEKDLESHRRKSHEKLAMQLSQTLRPEQLKRLCQMELQHQGPHALGRPDIVKELNITQEQLMRFMGVFREMHQKIEPLVKQAQSGGNQQEIRAKAMNVRRDQQAKLEALLTDAQKQQWQELLGKPFDLAD